MVECGEEIMKVKKILGMLLITVLFTGLTTVNVIAYGSGKPASLDIETIYTINEGELFQITVTSRGEPIRNVKVKFAGQTQFTDVQGKAWVQAPLVDLDSTETLQAAKKDYVPARESILIIDLG